MIQKRKLNYTTSFFLDQNETKALPIQINTALSSIESFIHKNDLKYIVIFAGSKTSTKQLIIQLKKYKMPLSRLLFVFLNINEQWFTIEEKQFISRHLFVTFDDGSVSKHSGENLFYSLITKYSTKEESFSNDLIPLFNSFIITYKSVLYLQQYYKSFKVTNHLIRSAMYEIIYDGPVGKIHIEYNNILSQPFHITTFSLLGKKIALYPGSLSLLISNPVIEGCYFGPKYEYQKFDNNLLIGCIIATIATILFCIAVIIFVFINRSNPIIISTSPTFLYCTLGGCIYTAIAVMMCGIEPTPNNYICTIRIWLLAIGVTFIFAVIFTKTWRINKLFNNTNMMKLNLPNKLLIKIIIYFMAAVVFFLFFLTFINESKYIYLYV